MEAPNSPPPPSPASGCPGFIGPDDPKAPEKLENQANSASPAVRCLKPREAAKMLSVAPRTLQNWRVRDRKQPEGGRTGPKFVQMMARTVVYFEPDLVAFIEARRDGKVWRW